MQHPDEGLIHAWLDGELDAAEAARVEGLVASDPAWGAAAAEARGLIAASSRIVGNLDHVPANVIPARPAPVRRGAPKWVWRAAAVLALMAGSAVVLERGTPELPAPRPAKAPIEEPSAVPPVATPPQAATSHQSAVAPPAKKTKAASTPMADSQSSLQRKELDIPKQIEAARDKDVAPVAGAMRANAAAAPAALAFAQEQKTTRLPLSCFEQRQPPDSASRIIRLSAGALADSVRLEKLTLRGDTLAAVNGPLIALRVRCPAP